MKKTSRNDVKLMTKRSIAQIPVLIASITMPGVFSIRADPSRDRASRRNSEWNFAIARCPPADSLHNLHLHAVRRSQLRLRTPMVFIL